MGNSIGSVFGTQLYAATKNGAGGHIAELALHGTGAFYNSIDDDEIPLENHHFSVENHHFSI